MRMKRVFESVRRFVVTCAARHGKFALAIAAPLLVVFGRALYQHIVNSANPLRFNEDARQQIYPFFSAYDSELFKHDYIADYYRDCIPFGYRALYGLGGHLIDPSTISKIVPYVLIAIVAGAVAAAARPFAGYGGALFASSLVFATNAFFDRIVGGLPRSFGYPIAALAAALLVYGRVRALGVLVCVGAAFYPAGAMPAGIALTMLLFVLPAQDRGEAADWSLARRARMLVTVGAVSALILLPTVFAARSYGRILRGSDVTAYPEIGPGGRYIDIDRMPFVSFPDDAIRSAKNMFRPAGPPVSERAAEWTKSKGETFQDTYGQFLLELMTALLATGCLMLVVRRSDARRLLLFAGAAWGGHILARLIAPNFYLPQRYAVYPVPILLTILLPATAVALGGAALATGRSAVVRRSVAVAAMAAFVLVPFGGFGDGAKGLMPIPHEQAIYTFLAKLPKDSLIAGWPYDLNNVPYISRRQPLVTYETHQAFHQNFADEMRRRMRLTIDAYYAVDLAPINRLRDELHVTHFLVRRDRLRRPSTYFKPFTAWSEQAFRRGIAKGFELSRQIAVRHVYADGTWVVLDLKQLKPTVPPARPNSPTAPAAPAVPGAPAAPPPQH